MPEKSVLSDFQLQDWRLLSIEYHNTFYKIPEGLPLTWTIQASRDQTYDNEKNVFFGTISLKWSVYADENNQQFAFSGLAYTMFTMQSENGGKNDEENFTQYASKNAMAFSISALRTNILNLSSMLQIGRRIILPNINLNRFDFDKEYSLVI